MQKEEIKRRGEKERERRMCLREKGREGEREWDGRKKSMCVWVCERERGCFTLMLVSY